MREYFSSAFSVLIIATLEYSHANCQQGRPPQPNPLFFLQNLNMDTRPLCQSQKTIVARGQNQENLREIGERPWIYSEDLPHRYLSESRWRSAKTTLLTESIS